jgi:hypothetical protein
VKKHFFLTFLLTLIFFIGFEACSSLILIISAIPEIPQFIIIKLIDFSFILKLKILEAFVLEKKVRYVVFKENIVFRL